MQNVIFYLAMHRNLDLKKDNLWKLAFSLAIPTALAQLVNVLYAIVDRMFIGHIAEVGDLALAGVGVAAPITTFITSFAALIGLGGAPIMAMKAGYGQKKEAEVIVSTAFYLLVILSLILAPIFFFLRKPMLMFFGASSATFPYASSYIGWYLLGTPFALLASGMNSYLINQGKTARAMSAVFCGAILNTILDPVFIFILNMGVKGAAIATVISQLVSAFFVLFSLVSKKIDIRLYLRNFDYKLTKTIMKFGLSPFLIMSTDSALLIVLNSVLQRYGGDANGDILITAATIVQSYFTLLMNPLAGITGGCQGLISYNYGAGLSLRVKKGIICIQVIATLYTMLLTIATPFFAPKFALLFTKDASMALTASRYMRIFTLLIIPLSFQYVNVDEMTALGKIRFALPLSLFRKCTFFIATITLPIFLSADSAFYAEPLCDLLSGIVSTIVMWTQLPKILAKRDNEGLTII